jgi:nicotinamide-nucleotide amidase
LGPRGGEPGGGRGAGGPAEPYLTASLSMFGIPESEVAKTLRETADEVDLSGLEITTCLRRAEVEVEIRHRPGAEAARERVVEGIIARHGRFVFSRDGSSIDEQVAGLLGGRRIGIGESCTAGLLAARLTGIPGASDYVAGAMVAYSNESKRELLGVPAELLEEYGAVSPQVAEAMADGAMKRFHADVGAGITGIAGPEGGTEDKPVGYVCICVKTAEGAKLARDPVLPGDRTEVRDRSTTLAMHLLRRLLRGEDFPR